MDDIKELFFVIVVFIMVVGGFIIGAASLSYTVQNVQVVCKVDKKEVYRGRSACINVASSGASTTVSINGGFLCMFPKEYYVSSNVEMQNA